MVAVPIQGRRERSRGSSPGRRVGLRRCVEVGRRGWVPGWRRGWPCGAALLAGRRHGAGRGEQHQAEGDDGRGGPRETPERPAGGPRPGKPGEPGPGRPGKGRLGIAHGIPARQGWLGLGPPGAVGPRPGTPARWGPAQPGRRAQSAGTRQDLTGTPGGRDPDALFVFFGGPRRGGPRRAETLGSKRAEQQARGQLGAAGRIPSQATPGDGPAATAGRPFTSLLVRDCECRPRRTLSGPNASWPVLAGVDQVTRPGRRCPRRWLAGPASLRRRHVGRRADADRLGNVERVASRAGRWPKSPHPRGPSGTQAARWLGLTFPVGTTPRAGGIAVQRRWPCRPRGRCQAPSGQRPPLIQPVPEADGPSMKLADGHREDPTLGTAGGRGGAGPRGEGGGAGEEGGTAARGGRGGGGGGTGRGETATMANGQGGAGTGGGGTPGRGEPGAGPEPAGAQTLDDPGRGTKPAELVIASKLSAPAAPGTSALAKSTAGP